MKHLKQLHLHPLSLVCWATARQQQLPPGAAWTRGLRNSTVSVCQEVAAQECVTFFVKLGHVVVWMFLLVWAVTSILLVDLIKTDLVWFDCVSVLDLFSPIKTWFTYIFIINYSQYTSFKWKCTSCCPLVKQTWGQQEWARTCWMFIINIWWK